MLNINQKAVVDCLRKHQPCLLPDLMEKTRLTRHHVLKVIEAGFISSEIGSGKALVYSVDEDKLSKFNSYSAIEVLHHDVMKYFYAKHFKSLGIA